MVPRKVHALQDIIDVKASEQMTAILTRQRHIILLACNTTRTVCFTVTGSPRCRYSNKSSYFQLLCFLWHTAVSSPLRHASFSFPPLPQVSCPHSCFNDMLVTGATPAGFVSMSLAKFGQLVAVGRSGTVWWYHDREFRPLRWKTQRPVEIVSATLGVPVRLRSRRRPGLGSH